MNSSTSCGGFTSSSWLREGVCLRLRGTRHIPALPQDRRRARPATVQQGSGRTGRARLAVADQQDRTVNSRASSGTSSRNAESSIRDPQTLIRQVIFHGAVRTYAARPARLSSLMTDVIADTRWSDQSRTDLREMYALLMGKASTGFRIASGQTLTPLPLVSAVIDCLQPTSADTVLDPACGTGSVLVAAHESMAQDQRRLEPGALDWCGLRRVHVPFRDDELPAEHRTAVRLPASGEGRELACREREGRSDRHRLQPAVPVDCAAARRTHGLVGEESEHAAQLPPAHCARPPDRRAGGGIRPRQHPLRGQDADRTVRLRLLQEYDVHTLLRLPTGVFARGGVKVNVVFFDAVRPRADGAPATDQVWIYDFRSGLHFAATQNPLLRADLDDFVECYGPGRPRAERSATDRFRPVSYEQLAARTSTSTSSGRMKGFCWNCRARRKSPRRS